MKANNSDSFVKNFIVFCKVMKWTLIVLAFLMFKAWIDRGYGL
jgi:hypothetical protein